MNNNEQAILVSRKAYEDGRAIVVRPIPLRVFCGPNAYNNAVNYAKDQESFYWEQVFQIETIPITNG